MLKCSRCRAFGHVVENCRARCDVFTRQPLQTQQPERKEVYVLECADNCYYVGCSLNVKDRFLSHSTGTGCEWTKLHPPLRLARVFTNPRFYTENPFGCQEQDEFYACVYNLGGVDHVRGWLYHNVDLSAQERRAVENQVAAHFDLCWKCGYRSHLSGDCEAATQAAWKSGHVFFKNEDYGFNE
jgi:hypothetical protein